MKVGKVTFLLAWIFLLPVISFGQQISDGKVEVIQVQDSLKFQNNKPEFKPKAVLGKYDYYNSLGVACKAELKLEKATKIPLRFRLGSLQQTDYMERKPNVQKPE